MKYTLILFLSLLFISCSNSKSVPEEEALTPDYKNTLNTVALDKIGPNYVKEFNSDSSFVLVKNPQNNRPFVSGVFFVFDVNKGDVILEDVVTQGRLRWTQPYELEVLRIPGIVRDGDDSQPKGYKFDTKKRRRTPIRK